jgi:hypothetical protein
MQPGPPGLWKIVVGRQVDLTTENLARSLTLTTGGYSLVVEKLTIKVCLAGISTEIISHSFFSRLLSFFLYFLRVNRKPKNNNKTLINI